MNKISAEIRKWTAFVEESRDEYKKVTWPNRDEVTNYTIATLVAVVSVAIFLWLIDSSLMLVVQKILK